MVETFISSMSGIFANLHQSIGFGASFLDADMKSAVSGDGINGLLYFTGVILCQPRFWSAPCHRR